MSKEYFVVDKINVKYGDIQVLWDVSFKVDKGEIVAIVGSNGAGKSTIVNTCAGILNPTTGTININNLDISKSDCRNCIDNGIVLVPEGRQLFFDMTVFENLELGACTKEAREVKKDTLSKIFTWFPVLKERKNQLVGTLSGGEQQMVAFSRGMMGIPKLLIMDEPSLGLAPNIVDNIFNITRNIVKDSDLTVIIVEQDVKKALKLADRGYVLENGHINISGTAKDLLSNEEVKKAYLGF